LELLKTYRAGGVVDNALAMVVLKAKIAETGDYNLTGDRYIENKKYENIIYPMVKLGNEDYFKIESGGTPDSNNSYFWDGDIKWATLADLPQANFITEIYDTKRKITSQGLQKSSAKLLPKNSILVSSRATIGRIAISRVELATNQGFKNIIIKDFAQVNESFVALMLSRLIESMELLASGGTFKEISKTSISTLEIPLPPLEIQNAIVAEIEQEQAAIEACKKQIKMHEAKIKTKIAEVWGVAE
jgi:type I restriction enzyme M protein